MGKILYPELSYKIMAILFDIHNQLGNSYKEQYYQRAIEVMMKKQKIPYAREVYRKLVIDDVFIGKQYVDFIVDDKIALEIKTVPRLIDGHFKQLLSYIRSLDYQLGIIANFRTNQLSYKRLINIIEPKN